MLLEKEKPFNEHKKNIQKRREVLKYLSLIKYLSMIIIIRWHLYDWKKRRIDYGARMCELLFVSSGFLVGYNYYARAMPATYYSSFKYAYKHLRSFYPLHIINCLFCIFKYKKKFNLTDYAITIFNFLLLKVWRSNSSSLFPNSIHFNQITWFVSDLLFCYFLSPFLLGGIQKIYNSLIIFSIIAFIRVGIEVLIKNEAKNFKDFSFHHSPIIKLMEFYLGMLMIPLFFKIKSFYDKIKNNFYLKILYSYIQIIFPIIIYFIMLIFNGKLIRGYFVLIFCLCIFLISFDYGYSSIIIKNKIFKEAMSCQLEMYLLQLNLNKILVKILKNYLSKNTELKFLIKIEFIFIISYIYRKLFREELAIIMDKIVDLFQKLLFI